MYKHFLKRLIDFFLSLILIIILSPLFVVLTLIGFISLGGNPFFVQERPGLNEEIFKLVKFRTMKNGTGSDEERLTKYGTFLRKTSLDELPEMFNILFGQMAFIGPRPLLVKYLPRYNNEQRKRHNVRPGLTGLAQVSGRNAISWDEKFKYDVYYVNHLSFALDVKILIKTILVVLKHSDINSSTSATMEEFMGNN